MPLANPQFSVITSGSMTVPTSAVEWSVQGVSGAFYINGAGPFAAPATFSSASTPLATLNVGCTGGSTVVYWGQRAN